MERGGGTGQHFRKSCWELAALPSGGRGFFLFPPSFSFLSPIFSSSSLSSFSPFLFLLSRGHDTATFLAHPMMILHPPVPSNGPGEFAKFAVFAVSPCRYWTFHTGGGQGTDQAGDRVKEDPTPTRPPSTAGRWPLFLRAGPGLAKSAGARELRHTSACGKSMRGIEFGQTPQRLQKRRMHVCIARPLPRPACSTAVANSGMPIGRERGAFPSPSTLLHIARGPSAYTSHRGTQSVHRLHGAQAFLLFLRGLAQASVDIGLLARWTVAAFAVAWSAVHKVLNRTFT